MKSILCELDASYAQYGDFGSVTVDFESDQYDSDNDIFIPDENGKINASVKVNQISQATEEYIDDIELVGFTLSIPGLGNVIEEFSEEDDISDTYEIELDANSITDFETDNLSSITMCVYARVFRATANAAESDRVNVLDPDVLFCFINNLSTA